MCICVCVCVSRYPSRPGEGAVSPPTGVTGSYELPHAGARNQTYVLCQSCKVLSTTEPSLQPLSTRNTSVPT